MSVAIESNSIIYSSSVLQPNLDVSSIDNSSLDLFKENDRRKTFQNNNWSNQFVNGDDLAIVGLYFYKKPDAVKCIFCDVALRDFEQNDTALGEHLKWSPNCPLLRRRPTNNVPLDDTKLNRILPPVSFDECGFTKNRRKSKSDEQIKFPEFKLMSKRLKSFEIWPVGIKQRPQELAEAGFFYNGQSDLTTCFACGVFLCNWEPNDNVWVEHKKHAKTECIFLKRNHETVKLNEKKYEEFMKLPKNEVHENQSPTNSKEIQFESLCKICLERKSSVLFLPCRHVAVCGQCVFGIDKDCPICRTPISEKIHLYYA